MGQVTYILLIAVLFAFGTASCQRIELGRNKIVFLERDEDVVNAIHRMEFFMNKFPKTYMVNCFVDNDGYLYLSNQRIAPIKEAINNPKVRNDVVFESFNEKEVDEFFNIMAFLIRNDIDGWHKESSIGKFLYSYKNRDVKNNKDLRLLMVVDQKIDTSNTNFKKYFKVLDTKSDIVLLN